jgi:hypothetical protein
MATYPNIPTFHATAALTVWALLLAPIVGLFASGYVRVIGWVSHHRVKGWPILVVMPTAFALLGLTGLAYPQLFGNGKGVAHEAFLGNGRLTLFMALFALKPIVTALCLGAGASGGLLTPVMSTAAVLGGFFGLAFYPPVARNPGRQLCARRRCGDDRCSDASSANGRRAHRGTHAQRNRTRRSDDRCNRSRYRHRQIHRRLLHLLSAPASPGNLAR